MCVGWSKQLQPATAIIRTFDLEFSCHKPKTLTEWIWMNGFILISFGFGSIRIDSNLFPGAVWYVSEYTEYVVCVIDLENLPRRLCIITEILHRICSYSLFCYYRVLLLFSVERVYVSRGKRECSQTFYAHTWLLILILSFSCFVQLKQKKSQLVSQSGSQSTIKILWLAYRILNTAVSVLHANEFIFLRLLWIFYLFKRAILLQSSLWYEMK